MNAERSVLHELVDDLPDEEVGVVLSTVRSRLTVPRPVRSSEPFAWVGSIVDGPEDASTPEQIDAVLARGFGR